MPKTRTQKRLAEIKADLNITADYHKVLKAKIMALVAEGKSDATIARHLDITMADCLRYRLSDNDYPTLVTARTGPRKPSRIDKKPKSDTPRPHSNETSYNGKRANKPSTLIIGDDGLPVRPNTGKVKGTLDIIPFLDKLSSYSMDELQQIMEHRTVDGKTLSIHTLSLTRMYMDALGADTLKDRALALKLIMDRRYGTPTSKLANADGTNVNPLLLLIDPSLSRLQPSDDDDDQ